MLPSVNTQINKHLANRKATNDLDVFVNKHR